MEFRRSKETDIEGIMLIIKKAQNHLKEQGIDQWQNGYPNEEVIKVDIEKQESYVLIEDEKAVGTTALSFEAEKTYDNIYDGKWLTDISYAVIHRIAIDIDFRGKGLAREMLKEIEKKCADNRVKSIKVDTHKENISMQNFLKKNGFKYCGIIYLKDGNERVAFEKVLNI
ncbi:GNAT family N-acetyltransferase [Tissierella creatinophila]|uniref:Acetyltransferase (GNAT) family protein n=1 Tax=Tissierella creatinophila DSM 6911 TaxID=1123403 RepID=A0A1U7M7I9_TISCR|nr:GNAT family N-acetyltransferase [Tissierella creatinophila]OLS03179.1 acetyltransferase (GNAT) family protein [Tissierella creatinophila DSM 6911]